MLRECGWSFAKLAKHFGCSKSHAARVATGINRLVPARVGVEMARQAWRLKLEGCTISETARQLGLVRSTIRKLLKSYAETTRQA